MPLEPLPIGAIKMLLEARLRPEHSGPGHSGASITGPAATPCGRWRSRSNCEAGHSGGERAGDLPVPRTLSDAIELRLRHLDPRAGPGAAGRRCALTAHTRDAPGRDPGVRSERSRERRAGGVIEITGDRLRFTHPLLASTHYANTPVSKRRELHRLLATVIDDEEERAQHLALGAEAPDPRSRRQSGEGRRRGRASRSTESAAQLLEDAARLTPIDQTDARERANRRGGRAPFHERRGVPSAGHARAADAASGQRSAAGPGRSSNWQ